MRLLAIVALLALVAIGSLTAFDSDAQATPADRDPLVVAAFGIKTVDGRDLIAHVTVLVPAGQTPEQATGDALRAIGARPLQSSEFSLTGLKWGTNETSTTAGTEQRYNNANDPVGLNVADGGLSALNQVLALWSGASTAFAITLSTEPGLACPSLIEECGDQTADGHNDIAWGDLKGGSTLGVTWFDTVAVEADVMLNTKFQWTLDLAAEGRPDGCRGPSSRCTVFDAFTVMLHEEGHVVGAGHSSVDGALMEPVYEGDHRWLHDDDIDAVVAIYEGTTSDDGDSDVTGAHVDSVDHDRQGGRQGDKNLVIAVLVGNASHTPLGGVEVSIRLTLEGGPRAWVGTATTGSDGFVSFTLANAKKGCYTTTVTALDGASDGMDYTDCDL